MTISHQKKLEIVIHVSEVSREAKPVYKEAQMLWQAWKSRAELCSSRTSEQRQ